MPPRISIAAACLCIGLITATGCNSRPASGPNTFEGLDRAERFAGGSKQRPSSNSANAAFSINGRAVAWEALSDRLAEAAGAVVVEEVALDYLIETEAAERGVTITQADLDNERDWLAIAVTQGSRAPSTDPVRLITEVRQRRGLGPERFAALLRRNALLRAMVRESIEVSPEQVELAWRIQHGGRVRIRLIIAQSLHEAQALHAQAVAAGNSEIVFAKLAETHSTDNSAPLGGLIEPFSTEDPAYEESVRRVAAQLAPGQIGPVVATANGYAVVLLTERLTPDGVALTQVREQLREQLTRRQERVRMDELATRLLGTAHIRVIDPSLSWSVEAGRGG